MSLALVLAVVLGPAWGWLAWSLARRWLRRRRRPASPFQIYLLSINGRR